MVNTVLDVHIIFKIFFAVSESASRYTSFSSSFQGLIFLIALECFFVVHMCQVACVADALNLLYIQMVWTSAWAGCNAG